MGGTIDGSTRFTAPLPRMGKVAFCLAIVLAVLVPGQAASAASAGAFNYVQCIPSSRAIIQDIEAYRSWAGEYVVLQGGLVNRITGARHYSEWLVGTGVTAHAAVQWSNVPSGEYDVYYLMASWNPTTQQYGYSPWVRVTGAGLNTYGTESSPGSGVYIGGVTGRCVL